MAYTKEQKQAHRAACEKEDCWCKKSGPNGKRPIRQFITIDGEALGETGYHLLAASTGDEIANTSPEGLSSADCLRFLLTLAKKHKKKSGTPIYCGFALGYDCEHWIRDFGPSLWQQFKEKGEAKIRLDGRTYVVQYIPKKWFKIGFYKGPRFLPFIEVFDTFSFFQASFIATVGSPATGQKKGWGAATAEEMAVLTEWKEKRGDFRAEDWEEIRVYNQIECGVLVRLMNQLRDALEHAGIKLQSWHGPGAVANFLLRTHNMKEHIVLSPEGAEDAIARAYFGGRFECQQIGNFEGIYDYDISSAYPFATTLLPSTGGRWERVSEWQGDDAPWTVYLVSWANIGNEAGSLKPFPWRDQNGNIHYPSYGRGWYWGWEVAAARSNKNWRNKIQIEDGWRLHPEEEDVFHWLKKMADERVAAKHKADDKSLPEEERKRWQAIERAYKLALNSVYGKTIQTVGRHKPFLCPMWAGLITSHTRSRLLAAALKAPKGSLICYATDGLFANAPIVDIGLGLELGDWELKSDCLSLELYQSGCYAIYGPDGEMRDSRFRGVSRKDIDWQALCDEWKKRGLGGQVKVTTRRFIGHRTALQRGNPELQCQWVSVDKVIDLKPGTGWPGIGGTPVNKSAKCWDAQVPGTDYDTVSTRYRKLPAGEMEWEIDENDVQPD